MSNQQDVVDPLLGVRARTGVPLPTGGFQRVFPGMRKARRKLWQRPLGRKGESNCFHVMSRITDGLPLFGDTEKEALVILLWKMARFCKVRILTYCVMDNHFHALIEVPDAETVREPFRERGEGDGEGEDIGFKRLLTHLDCLYSKKYVATLAQELEKLRRTHQHAEIESVREAYLQRIGDLSRFVWEVKERFTKWYNKHHGRRGTLWNGRFKSVLVQGRESDDSPDSGYSQALRTMAAYIDLNAVRAGLVEDPADYPHCAYAAAVKGSRRARRGLNYLMGSGADKWEEDSTDLLYRQLLYRHGFEKQGGSGKRKAGLEEGGRQAELGRLRAEQRERGERSGHQPGLNLARKGKLGLSKGLAVGEEDFVEEVFEANRGLFGEKRKRGRQRLPGAAGGIFSLRRVQRE